MEIVPRSPSWLRPHSSDSHLGEKLVDLITSFGMAWRYDQSCPLQSHLLEGFNHQLFFAGHRRSCNENGARPSQLSDLFFKLGEVGGIRCVEFEIANRLDFLGANAEIEEALLILSTLRGKEVDRAE